MQNGDESPPGDGGTQEPEGGEPGNAAAEGESAGEASSPVPTLPTGHAPTESQAPAPPPAKFDAEGPTGQFSVEAPTDAGSQSGSASDPETTLESVPSPSVQPESEALPSDATPSEVAEAKKRPRPPKVGPPTTFVRVLPDEFKSELTSGGNGQLLAKLVDLGFDVHLRENSVVGYWGGTVLAQFGRHPKGDLVLMIPRKLAQKIDFPKRFGLKGSQCCYKVNDEFLSSFDTHWEELRAASERADVKDGPLEQKFMTTNPGSAGVLPLDRQVQLPNNRAKLDCVAIEREGEQRMLLVELKSGVSSEIAKAHVSMEAFFKEATDGNGGLRDTIAQEYKKMLALRAELGIPSKVTPDQVVPGMPVTCLVALAHFRSESSAKDRLIDASSKVKFPLYLCEFAGSDARVPKTQRWEGLGKVAKTAKAPSAFG